MKTFKLWVDDVRQPPSDEWIWCQTTQQVISTISYMYERQHQYDTILISLDHDAGEFVKYGGDYIKVLDWLEAEQIADTGYFFHLHSQNPVGVQNMRAIIEHNGWREIRGEIS